MSQDQPAPQAPEQVWTDRSIDVAIANDSHYLFDVDVRNTLHEMRDQYEAKLKEYRDVFAYYIQQAIKDEAALTAARQEIASLKDELATLNAASATIVRYGYRQVTIEDDE